MVIKTECKKLDTGVALPTIRTAYSDLTSAICPTK